MKLVTISDLHRATVDAVLTHARGMPGAVRSVATTIRDSAAAELRDAGRALASALAEASPDKATVAEMVRRCEELKRIEFAGDWLAGRWPTASDAERLR